MVDVKKPQKSKGLIWIGLGMVVGAIFITGVVSWFLYEHTVNLLTDNLRERLLSIATTQVANIDYRDVQELQVEEDWKKPEWARVVSRLKKAKDNNKNIVFMYIFRKKASDPTQMEFVADAESLNPYANTDDDLSNDIDANGDGKIEPDGADFLQWPGQDYETPPEETFLAYDGPLTNRDLYTDSYGSVLTGYAPIKDEVGNVVAVLATDIKADDFFVVTRQTLYPFLLYIAFLIIAILILSMALIRIWGNRVKFLQEVDEQKNKVISIVAHQLQTPISAFHWIVELLRSKDISTEESASMIEVETKKLSGLASMFLEASHIQKGTVQMQKAPTDMNVFFKDMLSTISLLAKEKNIQLVTSIPKNLPMAMIDQKYTNLAIENLLSNAVKYTPATGKVEFKVEVKNETLYCSVKDTGIGIPKKDQNKIFGQMYRASNAGKDGNGLGLYASRGAIIGQGGKIRFESEEGKGTTFFIELPLTPPDNSH